jgi:hypothetical protein
MKQRTIGYLPHSKDLSHPADRRRLVFWAANSNIKINTTDLKNESVVVLTNAANFGKLMRKNNQILILDLVDGYLGENPSLIVDVLRNILKSFNGTSSLRWLTYSRHLKFACRRANCVIVASNEQRLEVQKYCSNVHVILDNHDEVFQEQFDDNDETLNRSILWEGFPYTFKHFRVLNEQLDKVLTQQNYKLTLVSKNNFKKWGGYIWNQNLEKLVAKLFPASKEQIEVIDWSIPKLSECAKNAGLAIIPVDTNDRFARLKPENKLLSMWALGIPTLVSPTPAYTRVMISAGLEHCLTADSDWASKVIALMGDKAERNMIIVKGRKYLRENHTELILLQRWNSALLNWINP